MKSFNLQRQKRKTKLSSKNTRLSSKNTRLSSKKKALLDLYEKHKLFAIDITFAKSPTKSKNEAIKIAKKKGLKYVMVCDYTEGDSLYDVKTKKIIKYNNKVKKYYDMVKGDKPGHGCKIPISIEDYN
tara:strand:- start:608 stop:991 length:384 start_codon:yes stop_codon:yes gene_type:complete